MSEVKNEGLDVVAVIEIGDPDHETGVRDSLEIIPHDVEFLDGEKLCRHSEALAGYAARDARISTLEFELEVAKTDELSAAVWAATEAVKHDLWDAQAELADAKETITRYETTAENCDVLRAELANQLEVKAFWIGRTRALEVELAAMKAHGVIDFVFSGELPNATFVEVEDGNGNSINVDEWLKREDGYSVLRLYAAPVQQVSVPDERANFESEYLKANYPRVYSGELSAPPIFGQAGKGEYEDDDMQKCWVMWQSRAMLAASPAPGGGQ